MLEDFNSTEHLNILNALNAYRTRKVSRQILAENYKINSQLQYLNKQIEQANSINKEILKNQLKEEEKREEQKYYKSLSFYLYEITTELKKITDKNVLSYLMDKYYSKTKSNIIEAIENCDEIDDKSFNKNTLFELENLKKIYDSNTTAYQNSVFFNLDNEIEDYEKLKQKLINLSIPLPKFEVKRIFRILGIVFLSIPALIFLLGAVVDLKIDKSQFFFSIVVFLIFAIPLFILIKNEYAWRDKYNARKLEINDFNNNFDKFNDKKQSLINQINNHPFPSLMTHIFQNYPYFDEVTKALNDITNNFDNQWDKNSDIDE